MDKAPIESVIYSDSWCGYNGLVDVGYSKHFQVSHGDNDVREMSTVILTVSNLLDFTKRRLAKFNGVSVKFELYLKESEWRWKKQPDEHASKLWRLIRYY